MVNNENHEAISLTGKRVVLLLQGGGALGVYQVGAYAALERACNEEHTKVDWVGGISIGAVNAAVIAGPKCGSASTELKKVWDKILSPDYPPYDYQLLWRSLPRVLRDACGWLGELGLKYAEWAWRAFNPAGQTHFFTSRIMNPLENPWCTEWFSPQSPHQLAFYDTGPLRKTLNTHINWDAVNQPAGLWLSLGAARVRDGEVVFFNSFDSKNPRWPRRTISADHVLASGALPPGFSEIQIDGDWYWDGGVSTNTPIEALAEDLTADTTTDTLVFLVDLWDRKGPILRSLDEAIWRQKSIEYGSRKEAVVRVVNKHQLKVEAKRVVRPTCREVCQVMFERPRHDSQPQFSLADADFSRTNYDEILTLGYRDMKSAIEHPDRVLGVGGKYAILYRHGTRGKHRDTDIDYAATQRRERVAGNRGAAA